jgi:hypothetical protein
MTGGHHDRTENKFLIPRRAIRRGKASPFSGFKLGERASPSPNLATDPARHLISIFKIAAKKHAPLGSDLIYPRRVIITGPVEVDDVARQRI